MNTSQLLANFDRISDAPDAIPHLRRFILDLAVRGRLVEQDPTDEPASDLLKRIKVKKAAIIKGGAVRTEKPLPRSAENELPYRIPPTWSWSQVAEIGIINPRNTADDQVQASFVPMPRISAEYGVSSTHEVRPWGDIKSGFTHFAEGDVALAKITPCFENGKSTIFRGLTGGIGAGTTELHVVRPIMVSADYVLIFLKCPHFIESGISRMTGTAGQKRVPTEYFAHSPFPLPPLAEQDRIVAKVDELMVFCDRLETAQAQRESQRDLYAAASYHHLHNSENSVAFREHARVFLNHLPHLTPSPTRISALRRAILNFAVRGRLVTQDANDEPASILLERLAEEIKKYACAQKISPPRPEPIREEEIPYPVPASWIWTRLCSIFKVITDGDHQPPPKEQEGVAFLTIGNVTTGSLDFSNCRFVSPSYLESVAEYRKPSFGDVLYTVVGATYGRPVLVDTERPFCVQRHIAILKPPREIDIKFLRLLLASTLVYSQATKSATGAAQPTVALRPLRNFLVPLPPLAEQHRIVAKVDELMAVCDRLEVQLTAAKAETSLLLEAVLHHSLAEGGIGVDIAGAHAANG
jgi:type I restriction enzyme S subunit